MVGFNCFLFSVRINNAKTRAHNSWYPDVSRLNNEPITAYNTFEKWNISFDFPFLYQRSCLEKCQKIIIHFNSHAFLFYLFFHALLVVIKIHRLYPQWRGKIFPQKWCLRYDTKLHLLVGLHFGRMWSIPNCHYS